jgi:heat shock protein 5
VLPSPPLLQWSRSASLSRTLRRGAVWTAATRARTSPPTRWTRTRWVSWIPPAPRDQPQIEVTFDVDENSILHVSAADKASGSKQEITITNDKGRLSEEEIERMVKEAADFEEEDRKMRENVEARNSLESVAYQPKNQVADKEKLGGKLSSDEKKTIEEAVKEAIAFLDENPNAEKEEYEEAKKTLTDKTNPIVSKVYQNSGGAGGAGAEDEAAESTDDL